MARDLREPLGLDIGVEFFMTWMLMDVDSLKAPKRSINAIRGVVCREIGQFDDRADFYMASICMHLIRYKWIPARRSGTLAS
jgi:hypothetical protein